MKRGAALYWAVSALLFFIGLVVRLYAAYVQPLWLDEQYSIYFAATLPLKQFFVGIPDVHPGLYYFLVRLFSLVSVEPFFLRVVTAVIPSMVGMVLMVYTARVWLRYPPKVLTLCILLIWCNPFVVNLHWQLRMYGLLTLETGLIMWSLYVWQIKRSYRTFFLLFVAFLCAQATSYLTLFTVVGYVFWDIHRVYHHKVVLKWANVLLLLSSGFYFLAQTLGATREVFLSLSWIPDITVANVVHVVATISGIGFNTMLTHYPPTVLEWLYVFTLCVFFCLFMYVASKKNILLSSPFFYFSVIPTFTIVGVSALLPFISHRFFLHTFVPDVSFFLPRSFIIQYLFGCMFAPVLFAQFVVSKKQQLLILNIVMCLSVWYIIQYKNFSQAIYASKSETDVAHDLFLKNIHVEQLWYPAWFLLRSVQTTADTDTRFITVFEKSQKAERILLEDNQSNAALGTVCTLLEGHYVFVKKQALVNKDIIVKETDWLNRCCTLQPTSIDPLIEQWICQ